MCALFSMLGYTQAQSASATSSFEQGVVRVKLQPEMAVRIENAKLPTAAPSNTQQVLKTGVVQMDRVAEKVKAVCMTRVFPYAGKDEEKHKQYGLDLWYDITFSDKAITAAQARDLYKAVPGISHAQRVPLCKPIGGERFRTISPAEMMRAAQASSTMPFNDPLLGDQWHYYNDGSLSGAKAGADINVFNAWKTGVTGSKDVIVAIIDGGFQVDHPDLKDNVWINEAELNGKPGVDDDGDGYVDDIYGYNFVINSSDISAHQHGTHVAGTVGATNGNGIGVCGVAGGSDGTGGVKMMVCQIFDSRSSLAADYAAALVYAADRGASIAQCSWGFDVADEEDKSITAAVDYFTKEGGGDKMKGGLCIFAAGNTSDEGNYYPPCLDNVVAVGAMTASGEPAYYSTRGSWVDVTAPGGLMDFGEKYGVLSTLPGSTYGYNEGTSMACPHVSGIAALILSKYGNPNFSNETLRTLLTSSVNDLYSANPEYKGLFGTGYIDAYKALQGNQSSTPDAVSDFTLTASHDNVLVEWTIPQSDETVIDHHVIYYSTQPFTAETDVKTLQSVSVDTKFKNCGDVMSYELDGLKANTTYYFALVAYNRWGTASAMSEVKSTTTNAGPTASVDQSSVSFKVDATKNAVASTSFNISNTGEGILKYDMEANTVRATYTASSRKDKPQPGKIVPFSGQITPSEAASQAKVVSADYDASEWPDTLAYYQSIRLYLGEDDKTLPNAEAQYFSVDKSKYPNGFNLTALRIGGSYGENPEIEIYEGSRSISTATLLKKVNYDYFVYNYDINLDEQLYFAPGSSFWVVVKFPAGQTRPLGAATATTSNVSQYSYYSSDNGASWTQLGEVLKGTSYESIAPNLTWAITCLSKNPDWSSVLNPEPKTGEVRAGESQKVTLSNDGQKLINGTYKFNIRLKTNEAEAEEHKVAVTMTATGQKPVITSKQLVDFGNILVGQSKTLSVELVNTGYGVFGGQFGAGFYTYNKTLTCSSDQFEFDPSGAPAVAARSKNTMTLTFKPTKAGEFTGTVTLTDKNKNTYSYVVRGSATEPAHLSMDNTEHNFGDLEVGGADKTATFTIKNTGKYPLQYVFPKYSTQQIEGTTEHAHKYGYTSLTNLNGTDGYTYEEAPELEDETDITSQFTDNNWQSGAVSLGFQFPFYGTDYDKIYITSLGGVAMNTITGTIGCMVPEPSCMSGLGYISAFGNSGTLTMSANSKVSYGHKDGKFVVKYKDVYTVGQEGNSVPVSFHMTLSPDGSVEVFYDDYEPTNMRDNGRLLYIGMVDADLTDPYTITDCDMGWADDVTIYPNVYTGVAFKIVAPSKSMIKSLSTTDGYVGIGESKDVTVTVSANDDLYAGALTNNLVMLTNDPDKASQYLVLKANIVGDNLKPQASLSSHDLDFGQVFRTSTQKRSVNLANAGKDVLQVTTAALNRGAFTVADDLKEGFSVQPGQSKDVTIYMPTDEEGSVSDVLTLTYADGSTDAINLKGTVIGCPTVDVDPASVEITTPYGADVHQTLTVANNGNEPMTFSIAPDTWFTFEDVTPANTTTDYIYQSASDGYDVPFDWQDVTTDYTGHLAYSYFADQTDYQKVQLPFEFPFYGKRYKYMYIYDTGFVSFTEPNEDYKEFPEPPATLPSNETFYKNIICPFWGNHTMSTSEDDGVYYKFNDDNVVVSYKGYGNSMMTNMNYQVILYPDGSFKFQYQLSPDGYMIGVFGLCGIQDETCTRGVQPGDHYIESGNALMFYPVQQYAVASGQSVSVPLTIHADELADTYNHELQFTSNVPSKESFSVPVTLTITGEPDAVFPESVEIEEVYSPNYETYYKEFSVVNKGSKAFTITDINSELFDLNEETWMTDAQLQVYQEGDNGGGGGVDPGPLVLAASSANMSWQSYYPGYNDPIVVGKDTVKFRICLFNTYDIYEKTVPMTFSLEGLDVDSKTVNVHINMTDAPYMTFDKDSILIVNAPANYKSTESVVIGNDGDYKLTYSLRLDPSGNDEATQDYDSGDDPLPALNCKAPVATGSIENLVEWLDNSAVKTKAASSRKVKDDDPYVWDVPSDMEYTNLLYYPILKPISNAKSAVMGSGTSGLDDNFYAATRYVAPEEGFNLSHVYFVGTVGDLTNVDIEATVIQGSDVTATGKTIGRGSIHVDSEEPASDGGYYGQPRILQLNSPVYINPNDTFYVVLKYPAGYRVSAVMASKNGSKNPDCYMANVKSLGGWVDIEEYIDSYYSYGAFGYFMTCIETEKGEPWIKMLTTDTEGTLAVGESKQVDFAINAASTNLANSKATLVVHSNDPQHKVVNYHIWLNKNAAPSFTTPDGTTTVQEAATANVPVTVADPDGDAFSVSLSDQDGIASIASYTNAEGTADGVSLEDGVLKVAAGYSLKMNVVLAPDYGTAGNHSFNLYATDSQNNDAEATVRYTVEHTNRAPVFVGDADLTCAVGNTTGVITYASLFEDPDGDAMTYEVSVANSVVADVYTAENGFVVNAKKVGATNLTVTATDANGAATAQAITLHVTTTGIDGVTATDGKWSVSDVNADGKATITFGEDADNVALRIYGVGGQLEWSETYAHVYAGQTVEVDLSSAPAGVYQLAATADGNTNTFRFVKKK